HPLRTIHEMPESSETSEIESAPELEEVAGRIESLREQVAYHNHRYHELDDPEIPDAEFDLLVRELRRLEAEHPELAATDSPSADVGGAPSTAFAPVEHAVPM